MTATDRTALPLRRTMSSTLQTSGDLREDASPADVAPVEQQGQMTHREILSALSGMLLAMFVAFLS